MASMDARLKGDLEILKSEGNKFFSASKFGAAAEKYTEAIALLPSSLSADHVAARTSDAFSSGKRTGGSAQDELRPQVSILYSNRAYCYKALGNLADMQRDAQNALLFDKFNAKAHYLAGYALCKADQWAQGIRSLELGEEMARRQKKPASLLTEFRVAIAVGRKDWHHVSMAEDREQDAVLHSALEHAVTTLRDSQLQKAVLEQQAREAEMAARSARKPLSALPRRSVRYSVVCPDAVLHAEDEHLLSGSTVSNSTVMDDGDISMSSSPMVQPRRPMDTRSEYAMGSTASSACSEAWSSTAGTVETVERDTRELLTQLHDLFVERETLRTSRAIPEHFICSITFDVMLDPVISPSGHSYEREAIERYVRDIKGEDPQTRTPLQLSQLVPNLALRACIQAWLEEYPWAHPLVPLDKKDYS